MEPIADSSKILLINRQLPSYGGGERVRTDDLLRARQALSQLSYTPRGNPRYHSLRLSWWA